MKLPMILVLVMVGQSVWAHDEGHGPKITDTAKQGGVLAPVIDAKETKKGTNANIIYKAELTRTSDGTVSVFLYSQDMKPLDLKGFESKAKGVLEIERKKKYTRTPFVLNLKSGAFVGKAPKARSKPFNIDVTLKESGKDLLVAFENLD